MINTYIHLLSDNELVALSRIVHEYVTASRKFGKFNSAHEGYAVLLEEVDELWDEVRINQAKRNNENLQKEATQVAAMGMRFLVDIAMNEEKVTV